MKPSFGLIEMKSDMSGGAAVITAMEAISKLNPSQSAYHFISGYTSKLAGTEDGVNEPVPSFSACFGAPFMPLHPTVYAKMLIRKMSESGVDVWLVNTGWTGGPYGIGKRMELKYTRAMINAAMSGDCLLYTSPSPRDNR